MSQVVIGVDPGLSGAFAVVVWSKENPLVTVVDMPRTSKGDLDTEQLAFHLGVYCPEARYAVVEAVSGGTYTDRHGQKRGQGSAASFAFGKVTGIVHGVLAANCVPFHTTPPSVWKMSMGLSRDKNASRVLAQKYFPESAHLFSRVKDDGRAEAALLALYGLRHFK